MPGVCVCVWSVCLRLVCVSLSSEVCRAQSLPGRGAREFGIATRQAARLQAQPEQLVVGSLELLLKLYHLRRLPGEDGVIIRERRQSGKKRVRETLGGQGAGGGGGSGDQDGEGEAE